nr:hypothetical protein [Tanacetum cinerariifolium]
MVRGSIVKEMTTNFEKLDKFEGHDFRQWQKKMHFLLTTLKVVYVLTTPMPELLEDDIVEAIRRKAKWENDDYIYRGHILNEDAYSKMFLISNSNNYKMVNSRPVMEQFNELFRILEQYTQHGLKMDDHLRIEESLRAHESDKSKGKEVGGPSMNMTEVGGKDKNNKQNKRKKRGFKENNDGSGSNKKPKLECWKCDKAGHFKRDFRSGNKKSNTNAGGSGKGSNDQSHDQGQNLWINSGATTHVCKDRCWFKTYELVEDGYVLYMGDDHFAHVHVKGSVVLEFNSGKSITLFNVLYVPKLRKNLISGPVLNKCGYKQDM